MQARRIGVIHARGLWTFYSFGLFRALRFGLEALVGPVASGMLFLLVFSIAIGGTQDLRGGVTFLQYLAPGIAMFTLIHSAFEMAAFPVIYDKIEGIIQDPLMSPLAPWEVAAGYALTGATVGLMTGGATLMLGWAFVPLPMHDPAVILGFAVAAALLFGMCGTIAGLWAEKWDQLSVVDSFLMLPLAFLSGAFFTVHSVPELGRDLIAMNPVFYAIDGARFGVLGVGDAPLAVGAAVMAALDVAVAVLVWRLFAIGYKIKP
ncbi:ABC transporter permease [Ferruginivarius sediminum]|jgi:ABC-2 type transport system permease protein|uniref:Transport permease protein n=1 Tax=Ferruginivarius sediminum TaxID=2661937 RepID=A0A369T8D0_9PROT|nr:ABC transporter permease [Ferruginivarius sediminum]RDD61560.1 multidrug ABC transporter permease [Ferruginivarius sediminum]